MAEFENLDNFLEHVGLVNENQKKIHHNSVKLMTLHAAKGLEFDHVYLPGWEEGIFPSSRALEQNSSKSLEEERRLAYVGITRAKKEILFFLALSIIIFKDCSPIPLLGRLIILSNAKSS